MIFTYCVYGLYKSGYSHKELKNELLRYFENTNTVFEPCKEALSGGIQVKDFTYEDFYKMCLSLYDYSKEDVYFATVLRSVIEECYRDKNICVYEVVSKLPKGWKHQDLETLLKELVVRGA